MVKSQPSQFPLCKNIIKVLFLIYILLISIGLVSTAFKLFGADFARILIQMTSNPFIGLFFGIFATSLVQSSSSTTSIVVGMVASGVLTVPNAIPIIMGANIGTTVTNIIVSMGHITRKEEFKRAFAGALMHDYFNVISVCILLPLELTTHVLEKTATYCAQLTFGHEGFVMFNPVKPLINPVIKMFKNFFLNTLQLPKPLTSIVLLILGLALLFISLYFISKTARALMRNKTEILIDKALARAGWIGIVIGIVVTAIIQSSSITTSILVPLIGAGVLSLESAFPITLGANIGTTVTAMLAALTGNIAAVTIAFVHLFFNIFGIGLLYPIRIIRHIPINLAKLTAQAATEHRKLAIVCIFLFFYIIPGILAWLVYLNR